MPKGLLTFGSPKNAQNFDFFMYTKTGSDLTTFGKIQKIQSGSPVLNGEKNFFLGIFDVLIGTKPYGG